MENKSNLWRKNAYINIHEPVNDIVVCNNMTIIWTKTSIIGYEQTTNKQLWKIKVDSYSGASTDKRLMNFNGKAIFSLSLKGNADMLIAIEPETGKILWSLSENFIRTYVLIQSKTQSNVMPVYNRRKEGFVENKYIVFVDLETGKKVHETKIPLFYYKGFLAGNHLFINDISGELLRTDLNSPDKTFSKVCLGQVDSIFQKDNFVYYLLKDKANSFTINKIDLSNNQTTTIEWPDKKSLPSGFWKILDDFTNNPNQLLISWGSGADLSGTTGTTKFGLLDINEQKLIWKESFTCNRKFICTPNGFFSGVLLRDYQTGSILESGIRLDFTYPNSLFYANNSLFYYDERDLGIYTWGENNEESKKADNNGTKVYNFKDLVKF